ncbi:hypothetical protein [Brevibacillus porteri]|uniref:YqbQ/XkdQ domain-containing protein n=1 Tax=Brevibacillus porteri TaxID=2126350 RepID=A0ABX5FFX1_9BACL|nr:hypothetical protein [Brevibacillus porteri]MED1802258.1 hypothetical protein [Brevibacillus porteri]MED2129995.1 hypothetical protein [Brevibacillus porteri]MED2745739.1 hypothetical protein [Brevibacillus porteri]MED2816623.1 hypothetical protein [Brevibacillus porteri]MED2897374.1 hypothetical protein [Brevibacillus porteri]
MKVIYGQDASRVDLTKATLELSWTSSRGQIAQNADINIRQAPPLQSAGFLMLFSGFEPKESMQFFHGPIVRFERDEKTSDLSATAYELSWYLQKNETSRIKLNGDAGRELERIVKATGIQFSCPAFGFDIKERLSSQSYASLFTFLTEKAYEKTGKRYFIQHLRDKLTVLPEGGNKVVPMFQASMLEKSSTGESIEEVYTVVTVEKYKGDSLASSVTKENAGLIKQIGRMQKMIDAGEEKNISSLASKQLSELSKIPKTRTITVRHEDNNAARLRAGWLIKITEKDKKTVTDWIVTNCNARWKGGQYTMDLQLERRT